MKQSGEPLSDRQRAVLSLLERFRREGAEVPTLSYLARHFRVHHSTMQEHLSEAHRKGYLRAPVPGPPIRELPALPAMPPLPIPTRDEDDVQTAAAAVTVEVSTLSVPGVAEPVRVEQRTQPGELKPSKVTVRTRTRVWNMDVRRAGGPEGPITGFRVVEEVEG